MVKIRMTRLGRNKLPFYRIIAVDARVKRDGGYIELLGTYEPFKGIVSINEERVLKFLNDGAQPSDTVKSFLKEKGIWKRYSDAKIEVKKSKAKVNKKTKVSSKKPKKVFSKSKVIKPLEKTASSSIVKKEKKVEKTPSSSNIAKKEKIVTKK